MKANPLHQPILNVLMSNPGAVMSENDIIAKAGLLPSMGARALYDMRTAKTPLIERVQMDGGIVGCKLIAEPELVDIISQNAPAESAAPAPAQAPRPLSAVSAVKPEVAASAAAPQPLASAALPTINGFTFGVDKISDQLLSAIKNSPRTGSDLLVDMEVSPEEFLKATRELEARGIVVTTEMEIGSDNDIAYLINEDVEAEVLAALSHTYEYEDGVAVAPQVASSPAPAAPAPAPAPAPAAVETPARVHLISSSGSRPAVAEVNESPIGGIGTKLGAVAQREERQRKEATAALIKLLTDEPLVSKVTAFDKVVDTYTVRGLKELLKELIEDGTIDEVRDGKNKFLKLGQGQKKPAAKSTPPVKVAVVEKSAPIHVAAPAPTAPVQVAAEKPEVAHPRASQPVRAASKPELPSASVSALVRQGAGAEDVLHELAASPADVLIQLADRMRQLEAENKFYRDLFSQLQLPEHLRK